MDKQQILDKLYADLDYPIKALAVLVPSEPHGANQSRQWTPEELKQLAFLVYRLNTIWKEIRRVESSPE